MNTRQIVSFFLLLPAMLGLLACTGGQAVASSTPVATPAMVQPTAEVVASSSATASYLVPGGGTSSRGVAKLVFPKAGTYTFWHRFTEELEWTLMGIQVRYNPLQFTFTEWTGGWQKPPYTLVGAYPDGRARPHLRLTEANSQLVMTPINGAMISAGNPVSAVVLNLNWRYEVQVNRTTVYHLDLPANGKASNVVIKKMVVNADRTVEWVPVENLYPAIRVEILSTVEYHFVDTKAKVTFTINFSDRQAKFYCMQRPQVVSLGRK